MQHVQRLIKLLGSAPQFTSEQTERCHIDMAKQPYKSTNRKGYAEQMCRYLDRGERIRMFSALMEWHSFGDLAAADEGDRVKNRFQQLVGRFLPPPVRNVFQVRSSLCSATTAFQLRQKPNSKDIPLEGVQLQYEVPNFIDDLRRYFLGSRAQHFTRLPFDSLNTWWRVRIQLKDPQDSKVLLPPSGKYLRPKISS